MAGKSAGMDLHPVLWRHLILPGFLDALLQMFGYPGGSGALLLAGELPLRYCTDRFALRKPCWSLPERGHVHSLLTSAREGAGIVEMAPVVFSWMWSLD